MTYGKRTIDQLLRGIQWSSALAAIVAGILVAATIVQTRIHDPITSPALAALMQRIERDPSNQALAGEIRALDHLARKAYFTSLEQVRMGTILFLAALVVFVASWKLRGHLLPELPSLPKKEASWWRRQTVSRRAIAVSGALMLGAALMVSVFLRYRQGSSRAVGSAASASLHWTNFRGPGANGIASCTNPPLIWDGPTMAGVTWKSDLPLPGNSSPVVWGRRIFLTGGTKDSREVYCYDLDNGKRRWRHTVTVPGAAEVKIPNVDRETGFASPTTATDGKRVYAIFATGELVALTMRGRVVWSHHLGFVDNHYGHSSSLLLHNGLLFVQYDQYENGKLFAFDGAKGKIVWQAEREKLSWSSPICVNTGSRYELILTDNESVISYHPLTGAVLWSHPCLYGEVGPSAAYASGRVFVANDNAAAVMIDLLNPGADGIPPLGWEWRGSLPSTASPVAIDTLVFLATAEGVVTCLHAIDGTVLWEHEFDVGFYSSPIIAGNVVFLMDRKGTMRLFDASGSYRAIGSPYLGEEVVSTPAILDGYILLRGNRRLFRIDGVR